MYDQKTQIKNVYKNTRCINYLVIMFLQFLIIYKIPLYIYIYRMSH